MTLDNPPTTTELIEGEYEVLDDDDQRTLSVAEEFLPVLLEESPRSRYLCYRVCGMSAKQARDYVGVSLFEAQQWRRDDAQFRYIDVEHLREVRAECARELISTDYMRNFKLLLDKDCKIILKSLDEKKKLTPDEMRYLLKIRQSYTAQQLNMLEQLLSIESPGDMPANFTEALFQIRRRETQ